MVMPWAKHVASGRELVRRAFDLAYRIGDLTFASYSWDQLITICLAVGDPLAEVQTECENGLAFAKRVRFGLVIHLCGAQLGLIRTLRGVTPTLGRLDHDDYIEPDVERDLASNLNLVFAEFYYWTRKVQARVFAGDYASAADAAFKGQRSYWTSAAMFETAEFRLYAALAHAGAWNTASPEDRPKHFEALSTITDSSKCGLSTPRRLLRTVLPSLRRRSHGSKAASWTRRTSMRRRFDPRICSGFVHN